ncbi:ribonuclease [Candidatus Micrarchaeota archaeon CG_4_10_14_0_2_um_filter_49_7]|nr:MAG: hypothetical protein AUJ13_05760 [Candidatus Micrarchaeota archaeon CG1_02_49_24]PIZ95580.1 MAG: ribonuclease [Candidatus Micrarchaeota archaeon CG_4_10_14_0_2_um_filter_49_7]HII53316.1 ribonuclease Z [Candidatus Micrarchaeota archaeon]
MLTITFLGTSAGVPTTERGQPSVAISYGDVYLFDCGEGTQRQMMNYGTGYGSVKHIFLTHLHLDHYLGIFGLVETLKMQGLKGLNVYGPGIRRLKFDRSVTAHEVDGEFAFNDKKSGLKVTAFPTEHEVASFGYVVESEPIRKFHEQKAKSLGILGILFREIQTKGELEIKGKTIKLDDVSYIKPGKKIVIVGDSLPCKSTIEAAKGADLLIHESTFDATLRDEAKARLHSACTDAAEVAKKAGVKRLVITHISPRYNEGALLKKQAAEIFPETEVAYDGMKIEMNI